MPDLTALDRQVASEADPLDFVPSAPNVCLTPAGPTQVPVPYPIQGTTERLAAGCETVSYRDRPVLSTAGIVAEVRGNEVGSAGDVVTRVTSGTAFAIVGAPTVLVEGAPLVVDGSPGFGNTL